MIGPVLRIDKVYYRTGCWLNQHDYLVGFDYYVDNVRYDIHGDLTGNPIRDYALGSFLDGKPFNHKRLIKVKPGMKFKIKVAKKKHGFITNSEITNHLLSI